MYRKSEAEENSMDGEGGSFFYLFFLSKRTNKFTDLTEERSGGYLTK
jgi:hypothetical protein